MERQSLNFRPTAPLTNLVKRAKLLQKIRSYFDSRGFIEVQTPVLSQDTVVDSFIDPLTVSVDILGQTQTYYLQTSPEFAMKRLIASGMTAIYQITPAFRKGDRGNLHNIEFSLLEWYQIGKNYQEGRQFLIDLIQNIFNDETFQKILAHEAECSLELNRSLLFEKENRSAQTHFEVQQRSFGQVFLNETGLDPHQATRNDFLAFADSVHLNYPDSFLDEKSPADENDWIDLIFSSIVQPRLSQGIDGTQPFSAVVLYDYPASQSQLAQTRTVLPSRSSEFAKRSDSFNKSVTVSERFELFVNGIELANGYHELCDSSVLRYRIQKTLKNRLLNGFPSLPSESRLLAAMDSGLPDCCGCALGLDRLLMVLLNASSIDEVLTFPIELA
ncbi:MAG: amino acid--tRNA ligase-related protein [Planctomycetia bacterium]|nr:amino acid--tRNA ligase-related protein [Planctomycetia bacterium]